MLYDPKWEPRVKHGVYSLGGLIEWLRTQPKDAAYDFDDCQGACLIGQYLKAQGEHSGYGAWTKFCDRVPEISNHYIAVSWPHTFGAALNRALAVS